MHTLAFTNGFLIADRPLTENGKPLPPVIKLAKPEDEFFYTYQCERVIAVAGTSNTDLIRRLEEAAFSEDNFDIVLRDEVEKQTSVEPEHFIMVTDNSAYLFTMTNGICKTRRLTFNDCFAAGPNDKSLLMSSRDSLIYSVLPALSIPERAALSISAYAPEITSLQYVDCRPPMLESPVLEELDFSSEASSFYPDRFRRELRAAIDKQQ